MGRIIRQERGIRAAWLEVMQTPKDIMKNRTKGAVISFVAALLLSSQSRAQDYEAYESILSDRADSIVKNFFGASFEAGAVLEVDSALSWAEKGETTSIFEDPHKQLAHCIITTFDKWDSSEGGSQITWNDSGGIAIIRSDRVIWHSKRCILDYSSVVSQIWVFADLNNDTAIDIIVSLSYGHGLVQGLWIMTPNELGGKLLNSYDEIGRSTILGSASMFAVGLSPDHMTKEIAAWDQEKDRSAIFRWNGSTFARVQDE